MAFSMNEDNSDPKQVEQTDVQPAQGLHGAAAQPSSGVSSNTPPSITTSTTTGGEDWLELSLYVEHHVFAGLQYRLDRSIKNYKVKTPSDIDEITIARHRFLVCPGASTGSKNKKIRYRWKLQCENGLVLLIMNRERTHPTMPNIVARATSLLLMQIGPQEVWRLVQLYVEALGADIARNKLSRVDACVDIGGVSVEEFTKELSAGNFVSRAQKSTEHISENQYQFHAFGRKSTGFTLGSGAIKLNVYDKLKESRFNIHKLEILVARRWGTMVPCATRIEFRLRREKLKQLGVDTVEDWFAKRADIVSRLTSDWFRLVQGPKDPKHPSRSKTHKLWKTVQQHFELWCGKPSNEPLVPVPTGHVSPEHLWSQVIGILISVMARKNANIHSNQDFAHESMYEILELIATRNMPKEILRKQLELGLGSVYPPQVDKEAE